MLVACIVVIIWHGVFFNTTLGGAIGTDGEYGNGAAARINPMIVGDMEVYSQQTTHEEMIKNCKVYVMWGGGFVQVQPH